MAGQQQEEIETIRSRTIEVKLSDADVKRISEKAAAHGLTVGELIENFIGDLVCGTYSNGSDERMYAEQWFERCWFGMFPDLTFLRYLIEWGGLDEVIGAWENIKSTEENIQTSEEALASGVMKGRGGRTYTWKDLTNGKGTPCYSSKEEWEQEERTIECDGRKVPYFDYHKDKLIGDISFIRDKIESSLEAIRERAKTAEPQSGFVARRESIMRQEQPKQDAPKIDTAYAEEMARKLSALRSEFVKAMVQSAERTSYQPNPIYERQANEIESISKTISEQSRTIKSLQEERDKLGIFKGREKKELQNKIDNFERLRRSNLDKLGALGVSEPSKADEAVKEKRSVAAQEQNRAKAAMQNRGAKERAEEVKAAFLEAAKQIPADQRQEILDRMGQQKEIPTMGRLQYYQAEAEARRQLDTALKQEAQTRERNRTHDRDRGI